MNEYQRSAARGGLFLMKELSCLFFPTRPVLFAVTFRDIVALPALCVMRCAS
jgi:hypothetical protein